MHQQRLTAGSMPWCGNQGDTPVTKYIRITIKQSKVFWSAHKLACESLQLIDIVVRDHRES